MHEHRDFTTRVLRRFRKSPPSHDREGLARQIYAALDSVDLRYQASLALEHADDAFDGLNEKRQHGSRRIGHHVQEFVVNFAGFVRVFGGFVDVVRQGGSVYAEAAYGTLSLLFMVSSQRLNGAYLTLIF